MPLADVVMQTRVIPAGKTSFTVRGLCFDDITALCFEHREQIDGLVNNFTDGTFNLAELLVQFPALAAQVIAIAADEPAQLATVRRLSPIVMIDALANIYELTIDEAGDLGKFVGQLTMIFQAVRAIPRAMQNIGESALPASPAH